jgi:hypothetical protein
MPDTSFLQTIAIAVLIALPAITWTIGYARGYAEGSKFVNGASYLQGAQEAAAAFTKPTPETLNAQYESWKASQQPTRSDP